MTDNVNDGFLADSLDRGHQAPHYQAPHEHDTAYQPHEQGDVPNYQPHEGDHLREGGVHDPDAVEQAEGEGDITEAATIDEAGIIEEQG